jgi:hypothetical protein
LKCALDLGLLHQVDSIQYELCGGNMEHWLRVTIGFVVSMFVGRLVLWLLIDKILWPRIGRKPQEPGGVSPLTALLGITERALYTTSLLLGAPQWIGIWLALKVAVGWHSSQTRQSPSDNLWLIGTAWSLAIAFVGAWIAGGKLPVLISK